MADVVVDAGDAVIARRRVEVAPAEESEIRVRVQVPRIRVRARVEPGDGREDAVAADDEATLTARAARWKLPEPRYASGVLAKYARLASGAERGAITEA